MTTNAEILEIRNPDDLTSTYDQIEIQRGTLASGSDMATIATQNIDTSKATDLTMGFTSHIDTGGSSTSYYRYRYKNSSSGVVSPWSDIYLAETSVMHTRFRRRMRDTNSANYYFENTDIDTYLANAINKLYPSAYNEVIDESLTTLADTEKYTFPLGVFRVNDIEFLNSDGTVYSHPTNFKRRARQILFDSTPDTGYTIRLYADKQFLKLAEVPSLYDDLLMDLMQLEALRDIEMDRSKFYKYVTTVNPEGGNLPSIARVIERLEIMTQKRLIQLKRTRRPSDIHLT
jgi:hypothetical protein